MSFSAWSGFQYHKNSLFHRENRRLGALATKETTTQFIKRHPFPKSPTMFRSTSPLLKFGVLVVCRWVEASKTRTTAGIWLATSARNQQYRILIIPMFLRALGRVVRKQVNVNPGLNVNWSIMFSYLKTFFTSNVWCSLRLLQLKTEGQKI